MGAAFLFGDRNARPSHRSSLPGEFSQNSKRDDETASRFRHAGAAGASGHTASMRARHHLIRPRVLLCALALAFALPVAARELSAQEAVAKVQQETSGKVLSVQTLTMGKRKFYRIKVLTPDGQVRVVQVAAEQ